MRRAGPMLLALLCASAAISINAARVLSNIVYPTDQAIFNTTLTSGGTNHDPYAFQAKLLVLPNEQRDKKHGTADTTFVLQGGDAASVSPHFPTASVKLASVTGDNTNVTSTATASATDLFSHPKVSEADGFIAQDQTATTGIPIILHHHNVNNEDHLLFNTSEGKAIGAQAGLKSNVTVQAKVVTLPNGTFVPSASASKFANPVKHGKTANITVTENHFGSHKEKLPEHEGEHEHERKEGGNNKPEEGLKAP